MFNALIGFVIGVTISHFIPPMVMFEWAKKGWESLMNMFTKKQ